MRGVYWQCEAQDTTRKGVVFVGNRHGRSDDGSKEACLLMSMGTENM